MNGLLVFNSANDLVFHQLNSELAAKMQAIAVQQGLTSAENPVLDSNILLQIFSPIISSQRVMFCQFDNTYTSFQCDNGLNFAFDDFLGHSFIKVGQYPVEQLKRHMGVSIALARRLFGPSLFASQLNVRQQETFSQCIVNYEELYDQEQSVLLEALPFVIINAELKRAVQTSLTSGLERLLEIGHQRTHALIFIGRKFVCMQSSKHALALSPADVLFLSLLLRTLQHNSQEVDTNKLNNRSVAVFLQGDAQHPHSGCIPCIAHFTRLEKGILLIQLIEYAPLQVASSMYDTFFVLQKIIGVQMQGDMDGIKPAFENLEAFVKQSLDALKRAKIRGDDLEMSHKRFITKWENLRKLYTECLRCYDRELLVRIESNLLPFAEELKQLFTVACCDSSLISLDQLAEVAAVVEGGMLEFSEFLAVKADRNLTVEAYLEEFPGLIHFIYINRSTGMMIAPDFQNDIVPKDYIWAMIEFARNYLKTGQTTVLWKDKALSYSWFLWFEDQATGTMKAVNLQQHFINQPSTGSTWKSQHEPGLLASDYYQALVEMCFPKVPVTKIKCCELFCIHLGLVPASCALEHSRRLVATIADVVGVDNV